MDAVALERVKVSPKVDLFLLAPADEGVNVGPKGQGPATVPGLPCGKDVVLQVHQVCLSGIEVLQ